jgi:uncharacterized protein YggE
MKIRAGLLVAALLFCSLATAETVRTVSVSGQGEVRAQPDRAHLVLGIEARNLKLDDARGQVTRGVEAVLKLTRDLKIDPKDVQATRFTVQPEYDWNNQNRTRNLLGYYVVRQIQVELKDLEKLGTLVERAVDLGANQMGDPTLDSSRRHDLEREALAKAVEDARLNAETMARAAGAKLGAVRTLSSSSGVVGPPIPLRVTAMKAAMAESNAADSYQSGDMTFNATVQVEYDVVL